MPTEAPTLAWPLPRDTISPSSIATFIRCAEQFRRKFVLGQRDPTGVSGLLGTAVHGAQEVNLRQKVITGRDVPLHEVEDFYADAFDRELDSIGGVSEIDWRMDDRKLTPSKAKDIARPVNRLYHEKVAPTIQPLATEQWIRINIPGVTPTIVGKIDILKQGAGKVDMKFGGSASKTPKNDWLLQAAIYNLADDTPFEWHTGSWGSERYGPAVHTPESAPALKLQSSALDREITESLVRSYAAAMVAYYRQFGPDDPWPGTGKSHQWACGYCIFHPDKGGNCKWWPPKVKPVRNVVVTAGNLL